MVTESLLQLSLPAPWLAYPTPCALASTWMRAMCVKYRSFRTVIQDVRLSRWKTETQSKKDNPVFMQISKIPHPHPPTPSPPALTTLVGFASAGISQIQFELTGFCRFFVCLFYYIYNSCKELRVWCSEFGIYLERVHNQIEKIGLRFKVIFNLVWLNLVLSDVLYIWQVTLTWHFDKEKRAKWQKLASSLDKGSIRPAIYHS